MGTYVCKLVTDQGVFYSAINDTVDQFVMPVFQSLENYVNFIHDNTYIGIENSPEDLRKIAEETASVYELTKLKIHDAVALLAKMKTGESLTDDEAYELYDFWDFLRLTVADHQRGFDEISKDRVDGWIEDLGMREQFPDDYDYSDIIDHVQWLTFQQLAHNRKYPNSNGFESTEYSTMEQCNKLAGRYVSGLAMVAQIAGPGKLTPAQIVMKLREALNARIIETLKDQLKKRKSGDRPRVIIGVYKQLATSHRGKQANGEYRRFLNNEDRNIGIEVVIYVVHLLEEYGFHNHAIRLQNQYL